MIGNRQYGQLSTEAGIIREAKLRKLKIADLMSEFKQREHEVTEAVRRHLLEEQQRRRHKQIHKCISHDQASDSDEDCLELHVQFDEREKLDKVLQGCEERESDETAHSTLAREFFYALSSNCT